LPKEHGLASMDITCGDCGARFRLDRALLKGEKGARVRCRRCGGHIVVRIPEESPVPAPVKDASPKEPTAFEADISGVFRSEPASSPVPPPQEASPPPAVEPAAPAQEWISPWPVEASAPVPLPQPEAAGPGTDTWRQEAHDPGSADPVPSEMPGTDYSRLEDLFVSPDKEAGPDRIPPPSEEYPAGENLAEETTVTEPERKAPSRRASSRSTPLIIFVLCLLLLAAGAFYFGITKPGRERLGKVFPGWATPPGSVAKTPYDIWNVKWSIEKETASGTLFVVKGEVANVGNVPSAGIRIQTTLLGKDNEALAETAAFAGNPLTEALLRQTDRPGIAGVMSNRFGEGNVNKEIPPGKALPFMVVFFDPPGEIAAVMVKAVDIE
jgi:predicted Zn finger-like uncharacterized protein